MSNEIHHYYYYAIGQHGTHMRRDGLLRNTAAVLSAYNPIILQTGIVLQRRLICFHFHDAASHLSKAAILNQRVIYTFLTDKSTSCLHYLLPIPRPKSVTSRIRFHETYPRLPTRTKRYSFVHYALNHYQKKNPKSILITCNLTCCPLS